MCGLLYIEHFIVRLVRVRTFLFPTRSGQALTQKSTKKSQDKNMLPIALPIVIGTRRTPAFLSGQRAPTENDFAGDEKVVSEH